MCLVRVVFPTVLVLRLFFTRASFFVPSGVWVGGFRLFCCTCSSVGGVFVFLLLLLLDIRVRGFLQIADAGCVYIYHGCYVASFFCPV
jgi:hypothetical protein